MTMLLLKLGTGRLPEGVFTAYALMDGTSLVDIFTSSSDDRAFEKAKELALGAAVEVEADMAVAAQRRGYPSRALTPGEDADRAHFTLSVFAPEVLEGIEQPGVLLDFFEAAYVFAAAVRRDTRQWSFIVDVRGTIGDVPLNERLGVLVDAGERPEMTTMTEGDIERLLNRAAELEQVGRMGVIFDPEPSVVAAALERAYGLTNVPRPFVGRSNAPQPLTAVDVEKLAALMGATGRHVSAGTMGMDWRPQLGGTLEVRLTVRGIAD
jgi:hypothetical protein